MREIEDLETFRLYFPVSEPSRLFVLEADKPLFFVASEEKFFLQRGEKLLEERLGKHFLFSDTEKIFLVSESSEDSLRIAVYTKDRYIEPRKAQVKISSHISLKDFPHAVDSVSWQDQQLTITLVRYNNILEKLEKLLITFVVEEDFKLKKRKIFITSEPRGSSTEKTLAVFDDARLCQREDELVYQNTVTGISYTKKAVGKVCNFEQTKKIITFIEKPYILRFIFEESSSYATFTFEEALIWKHTRGKKIYCLEQKQIVVRKLV